MKTDDITFWYDVDKGDIPSGRINSETKKVELCENKRGRAYASRKLYKKKIERNKPEVKDFEDGELG